MATERLYFSSDESLDIEKNAYDIKNIERHESRYHFAAKYLSSEMSVLDCACGSGYGSDILKEHCAHVYGVDIDQSAVNFAKSQYNSEKLTYLCGDIRVLADTLPKMDAVVCLETLEHVPDPRILLDGFMKVLKDDGKFIVSTPVREASRRNPLNSYHVLEYTSDDVRRVLNHYFYQVDVYLQDQDKFYRIDDVINWGFVVAVCKYPKNKTIKDLSLLIKDNGTITMSQQTENSYISKSAKIANSVQFKPSFDVGEYKIMEGVEIRENTIIESHNLGKLTIGENSIIGYNCWLNATGGIEIGSNTLIGANTIITSSSHHFKNRAPIIEQGMSFKKVTIGSNVWIGSNVSILEGAIIGDGSVIGANCVIKSSVLPNSIVKSIDATVTEKITREHVIFYLLPFSIRNNALTFECIYERYQKLAQSFAKQDWEVTFIATNELAEIIHNDGWQCISPSEFSIEYDDEQWFERWKCALNGKPDQQHSDFIKKFIDKINPQIVFCWNYDGLLKSYCRDNNVTIFFNELGLSREPNPIVYYSDPEGVNSTSAFPDFWNEFEHFDLSENEKTISRLTLGKIRKNYHISDDKREAIRNELGLANKKTILIALQVEDDSNIVAGSTFGTMQQYINQCLALKTDDIQFIIKKHPAQENCVVDVNNIPIVTRQFSTQDLVAFSDAVFTINSSLGFEALIAGKRIFTFGNAPYALPGLVVALSIDSTKNDIIRNINKSIDDNDLLKLVYLTYHQYFLDECKFFDAEYHLRRYLLHKSASNGSKAFFFDSGSYYKEREIAVNRFQNKVLQDSILEYEKWIESLKITENNAKEVSEWAQSLNKQLQEYQHRKTPLLNELRIIKKSIFTRVYNFLKGKKG